MIAAVGGAAGRGGHMNNNEEASSGTATRPEMATEPAADAAGSAPSYDWHGLVARIQRDDPAGMEELYRLFLRGVRFYFRRQLGTQEIDDKIHDTFLVVVQTIRRGELREPERLMGFVRTVVKRQIAAYIDAVVHTRREELDLEIGAAWIPDAQNDPEHVAVLKQHADLMNSVLQCMNQRDREILTRFYLYEQTQEQICAEMALSDTQFRLLKSRAKARLGELGRRRLQRRNLTEFFVRKSKDSSH